MVVTQNYPNEYLAVFLCCEIKTHKLSWNKGEELNYQDEDDGEEEFFI